MIQIFLWILAVYYLSWSLSQAEIGTPWRNLFNFTSPSKIQIKITYGINCILCTSFWIGMILTCICSPAALFGLPFVCQIPVNGLIGGGATKIIYHLIERIPNQFE